ncbi:DNA dependent ATPase [Rhizoctonia solani AG-1 IA]|uniref:DNA dependent ATPase n=1 Tax=Thanatephorus cucumeris (strain AG1-IA) TaxID=983506 RepID=L8WNG9_THACA|nr:DNA dependent ATPase [Rhizoctonia solani AG-1 IA]
MISDREAGSPEDPPLPRHEKSRVLLGSPLFCHSGRGGRGGGRANNVRGPTSEHSEHFDHRSKESQLGTLIFMLAASRRPMRFPQSQKSPPLKPVRRLPSLTLRAKLSPHPAQGQLLGRRNKNDDSDLESDNLDATDDEAEQPATKSKGKGKTQQSKKELEKAKAKAKAKHDAKRQKQDDEEPSEDEYKAPSKGLPVVPTSLPPIGSFEKCVVCGKSFTVTRYTMAADPPPGFLCHTCAKASGADPFKKAGAPRGRKPVAEKRKIVNFEQKDVFKSLATTCIEIIAKYIDDMEALGDIGHINMDKISKILAKQRSLYVLRNSTSKLFYSVENTTLTLYDTSRLDPPAFHTLIALNPNLEQVRLDYCRGVDCTVLPTFATGLANLTHLDLYGAFLARAPAFIEFFTAIGSRLECFRLAHSPRLDLDCCQALVHNCADSLTDLRLSNVGKLNDSWLPLLHRCTSLKRLELSYPGGDASLTSEPVVELLGAIGRGLEHLDLSGHPLLEDEVLINGVISHAPNLTSLAISSAPLLTDAGVAQFFAEYNQKAGLEYLEMKNNPLLSSDSLRAFLDRSTSIAIRQLVINGWRETEEEASKLIPSSCPELRKLDIGFVRSVDDYLIKEVLEGCSKIEEISCFGCNRVTGACPKKAGVNIYGVEAQSKR